MKVTIAAANDAFPAHHSASVVEFSDGTLYATWIRFVGSQLAGHDHAPSQIVSATSADGGRAWSAPRVLIEPQPGDVNVYNPSLLLLPNGELLFFSYRHLLLEWGKPFRTTSYLRRSTDNGKTFSAPVCLWENQPFGAANHRLLRLASGRLLLACGETLIWGGPEDNQKDTVWFSDDNGHTWTVSESRLYLPLRGTLEAQVAEAKDGSLVMTMRTQLGSVFLSRSLDAGLTWSKPQTTGLRSPESMPALARMPDGDLMLVWNDSEFDPKFDHRGRRSPLTIAVSRDSGRSWQRVMNIEDDPTWEFTNSSICFTREGKALVTYMASKMANPNPPGKLGRDAISLKAALVQV